MQPFSESLGAIATALAKAQIELANPEKTLTGTIAVRGGERAFRYASLATGLDLVRKCLGQNDIAVIQSTAVEAGQIMLTTRLIHASGEWIASVWPVCAVAEPSAQLKGAALTYARRYALFTLVGIAGEDDLDAPDLNGPAAPPLSDQGPPQAGPATAEPHAAQRKSRPPQATRPASTPATLDQMLCELAPLNEADALTAWALKALPLKNQLSASEAQAVEAAFAAKLLQHHPSSDADQQGGREAQKTGPSEPSDLKDDVSADTGLAIQKPVRERDRAHLRFVIKQPCLVCGRTPCDAHHVKIAQPHAMGRKVSDRFTVPICRLHHRELHRRGNERAWWRQHGIEPLAIAAALWRTTHAPPQESES